MQSKHIKEKYQSSTNMQNNEKSIDAESTFDKSNRLHTSSGYLNSGESLDNTSKSITFDSVSQKNNNLDECILSSTTYSNGDILNKNVSSENIFSKLPNNDIPSNVYYDGSILSSIKCVTDEFESIEDISFPSNNLLTDTELFEIDDVELGTKNIISHMKSMSSSDSDIDSDSDSDSDSVSDLMTDISGLSSLSADDFLTCPDTNSEQNILSSDYTYKTDIELEDITKSISMTSFYDSMRYCFIMFNYYKLF